MKTLQILTILALLSPAAAMARQTIPDQGAPPANLEQRNGHWTANAAPPDDTSDFQVHTVVRGDTLWAIARTYMDDPFLWPQLWEANEHIVNPHWIYPDDLILIRPVTNISAVVPPPPPIPEVEPQEPRVVQIPTLTRRGDYVVTPDQIVFDAPEPRPVSPVKSSDLYCSGFITTRDMESGSTQVIGRVPPGEGLMFADGSYLYVSRGSDDGVSPGDILSAIRPTRNVESPRDDVGRIGKHYLELGQMRAVVVQPSFSLVRIVHSCAEITVGDTVMEFNEIDFPQLPPDRPFSPFMPSSGKTTGAVAMTLGILHTAYAPNLGGITTIAGYRGSVREEGAFEGIGGGIAAGGSIVYLDLGADEGVRTGDIFVIYRPMSVDGEDRFVRIPREGQQLLSTTRHVIGELVVLKVEERAATALITFSSDAVSPGDLVELR